MMQSLDRESYKVALPSPSVVSEPSNPSPSSKTSSTQHSHVLERRLRAESLSYQTSGPNELLKQFTEEELDKTLERRYKMNLKDEEDEQETTAVLGDADKELKKNETFAKRRGLNREAKSQREIQMDEDKKKSKRLSINRYRLAAFQFLCRQEEIKQWLEDVMEIKFPYYWEGTTKKKDLCDHIKDGVLFCQLANKIKPGVITKINSAKSSPFLLMENLNFFIKMCQKQEWIYNKVDIFTAPDLYEEKNIPKVINCLILLEASVRKLGYDLPPMRTLDPERLNAFTEEELLRAEEVLEAAHQLPQTDEDTAKLQKFKEERMAAAETEKRKLEEDELERERKMKEEEERKKRELEALELENKRLEEERLQRLKEEEERKRLEEERLRKEEEERLRLEEERKRLEEEERKRKEEEDRRLAEEERKRKELEALELEKRRLEEEARKKLEEEERKRIEEEEERRRIEEEEERKRIEEEEERRRK